MTDPATPSAARRSDRSLWERGKVIRSVHGLVSQSKIHALGRQCVEHHGYELATLDPSVKPMPTGTLTQEIVMADRRCSLRKERFADPDRGEIGTGPAAANRRAAVIDVRRERHPWPRRRDSDRSGSGWSPGKRFGRPTACPGEPTSPEPWKLPSRCRAKSSTRGRSRASCRVKLLDKARTIAMGPGACNPGPADPR